MGETLPTLLPVLSAIGLMSFVARGSRSRRRCGSRFAGMVWSLIPKLLGLEIEPELILSVFPPRLLYADAREASRIDSRQWLRPISFSQPES